MDSYQDIEEFLNGNGMNFMLFQEALLDVLQLVLEPPPPAVNAMSDNAKAEYEGLQYGKYMVS